MGDKVALVTGASRGIGAACAAKLAERGFRVAVHCRSQEDKAREIADRLPGSMVVKFDLAEDGACQELVKVVKGEMGSLDVLVNNAGIAIDQILPFAKEEDFDKLIATNLKPVFLLSKFASKVMMKQKSGSIVNLSSVVGYSGNFGQSMYAATKAAITGFTKSIAMDLAKFGIRANCVAPGFIQTDMTDAIPEEAREGILRNVPLGRLGTPEEVAACVAFLASAEATYVTGTTLHVNGGLFTS